MRRTLESNRQLLGILGRPTAMLRLHSSKSLTKVGRNMCAAAASTFSEKNNLNKTFLHEQHVQLGGRMVPFCGWELPLDYPNAKVVESVHHTRKHASLFDVSHMLQTRVWGTDRTRFLEQMLVGGISALQPNQGCYSLLTNDSGGIVDDVVVFSQAPRDQGDMQTADHHVVVMNAGCREKDLSHIRSYLDEFKGDCVLEMVEDRGLLALQGPTAHQSLRKLLEQDQQSLVDSLYFFGTATATLAGVRDVLITRTGYTGEDGFELSVPEAGVQQVWDALLAEDGVLPAGLAARDVLRLEAGLCLYGQDLDETITPIEAGLSWTIPKFRRETGTFLGAERILGQLESGVERRRVGLVCQGPPAREYSEIQDVEGKFVGGVSSGTFSPTLKSPIAMGYVQRDVSKRGTKLSTIVRDKAFPAEIVKLPFVPTKYVFAPKV